MEEYRDIRKSLRDLVEGQKRNMAQLARIGAIVEWRWDLKEDSQSSNKKSREKDRKDKKRSEDRPRESQEVIEKKTPLYIFC